jgi:hypothetical protein
MNEADAWPAHIAQQKLGHCTIAHTKGYYRIGRLSINVFGFRFIGLPIFPAWQWPQNHHHHPTHRWLQTGWLSALLHVVSRLDMYRKKVLMYRTMVLMVHPTKVRHLTCEGARLLSQL